MIAKMKKLTFLIYYKEYEQFLEKLRELGVVHIFTKSQGAAENQELQDRIRLAAKYAAAIKFLQGMNVVADISMKVMLLKEKILLKYYLNCRLISNSWFTRNRRLKRKLFC